METFIWPIIGGVFIGLSAVFLMFSLGRIAGISGIAWGAINTVKSLSNNLWQCLFIIGLPAGAWLFHFLFNKPYPEVAETPLIAALAGLCVGIGTRLGNGCTSGHGVCGMGRLSVRSIAATLTFMVVAIITVALTR